LLGKSNYDDVLKAAWSKTTLHDLNMLATNSGASVRKGTKQLILRMIDRDCVVDFGAKTIRYADAKSADVSQHLQILILHYLEGSGHAQLANRLVTFREFHGGAIYYPAFKARAIDPVVKEFGEKADLLKHIGDAIRADPSEVGTVSFRAHFFPKVPVVVILWQGDEEVSSSANVLFDANAGKILATEDLSLVGGTLTRRLIQLART
jgi:hypothetical protein